MKKTLFLTYALVCSIVIESEESLSVSLLKENEIKSAEEVFVISYKNDSDLLDIKWTIEDDYYLYFDSILLKTNQDNLQFTVKEGEIINHEDEFFGETKIVRNSFNITYSIKTNDSNVKIFYQGCSDKGFCYPIQNKNINLNSSKK